MKLYFNDQAFSYELLRVASYAGYQGAEIGECLATAAKIAGGIANERDQNRNTNQCISK